jgi:hypothetical protein
MSSLSEAIAAKKTLNEPPILCVETDYRPVAMVTFCPWQAKAWTLPWSRLDALSFDDREEWERVELFFPHHHILMVGERLRSITDKLHSFMVRRLRDLPTSHRASFGSNAVFIAQLEVRLLADPKSCPPAGVPF